MSAARAPSTSAWVTRLNSSLVPPLVGCGLVTLRKNEFSPLGTIVIVPASTLPSGPPSTAVTLTLARAGKMVRPTSSARGTVIVALVRNRTPDAVRTMLPAAIRLVLVGSRFSKRTAPVALVSSTRLPVALNVSLTATGIEISSAGTTPLAGSGWVAVVSATIVVGIGPIRSVLGVTAIVADGRSR